MQLPKAKYEQYTQPMQSHINVGSGSDVTIAELAQAIAQTVASQDKLNLILLSPMAVHANGWTVND